MAADLLGLRPHQVMMVAAHEHDLNGAKAVWMKTAYVTRPLEFGPDRKTEAPPAGSFDLVASDFHDLAGKLGV